MMTLPAQTEVKLGLILLVRGLIYGSTRKCSPRPCFWVHQETRGIKQVDVVLDLQGYIKVGFHLQGHRDAKWMYLHGLIERLDSGSNAAEETKRVLALEEKICQVGLQDSMHRHGTVQIGQVMPLAHLVSSLLLDPVVQHVPILIGDNLSLL